MGQLVIVVPIIILSTIKLICDNYYDKKRLILFYLLLCISFFSSLYSEDYTPLILAFVLFSAYNINFEKIVKIYLKIIPTVLIILFVFSQRGKIPDFIYARDFGIRHSLGAAQPTVFSAMTFFAVAAFMYLKKGKLKFYHYVILLPVIFVVNYYTQSRNDFVAMLLLLLIPFLSKMMRNKLFNSVIRFLSVISYPFCALSVWLMAKLYDINAGRYIGFDVDSLLNGRIALGNIAIKKYPITLFGQNVLQMGNGGGRQGAQQYFFIDSSYLYILLSYGAIIAAILIVWLSWRTNYLFKNEHYYAAFILVIIGLEATWQLTLLTYANLFLLLLVVKLHGGKRLDKNLSRVYLSTEKCTTSSLKNAPLKFGK
jgi:hypothetical protein